MKYPNTMFIHYNDYYNEFECSDTTYWTNEVEYILKSDNNALTATIAQKDAEIERLREALREIAEFDADNYIRYETAIKFMKDMARLAWIESEVRND